MSRLMQEQLKNRLVDEMLFGARRRAGVVDVDVDGDELSFWSCSPVNRRLSAQVRISSAEISGHGLLVAAR